MSTISSGTTLTTALVQTGDTTGDLVIKTNNGNTTAVTFNTAGAIGVGSSPSYGSVGQYLQSAGNAAPATWATIASSQWTSNSTAIYYNTGNVGIGTSNPARKLDVSGSSSTYIGVTSSDVGSGSGLYTANQTNAYFIGAGAASGGTGLEFRDATNSATRMVINSSGRVGIGTSNPITQFVVSNAGANGYEVAADSGSGTQTKINSYNRAAASFTPLVTDASQHQWLTAGTERMRIDSSGNLLFNSGYGSVATAYGCRAWVNFNGTGTVSIRNSGNVSSITDNGTGQYTVNLTNALPDTNGVAVANSLTNDTSFTIANFNNFTNAAISGTSSVNVGTLDQPNAFQDQAIVNVTVFR